MDIWLRLLVSCRGARDDVQWVQHPSIARVAAQQTGATQIGLRGGAHARRQRAPIDQQAQRVQRLAVALADDLVGKVAAVQYLGLIQWLCLVGLRQRLSGQVGQAGCGPAEMYRCGVGLQVAGLAYALPQLLPLAGTGMGGQLAAQFEQVFGRRLLGVQCMKESGVSNSDANSRGLYMVPPAWVLGSPMLSG